MDIKVLREEFAQLHTESGKVLTKVADEKRGITAEEKTANEKRYARMDEIQSLLDQQKQFAKYAFEQEEVVEAEVQKPASPKGRHDFEVGENRIEMKSDAQAMKEMKATINRFARTGNPGRDQYTLATGDNSSILLPKNVVAPHTVRRLPNAFRRALEVYGYAPISRDQVVTTIVPVFDDTANAGASQSETATSGTEVDHATSGSLTLAPTLYTSKQQWYSNSLINAQDFDVFAYAMPLLMRRFDKGQESAFTTTALTKTVGKTTASTTGITYTELIAWEHSLDANYREDACFIVNDTLYKLLRGLLDNNNRPIMDVDVTNQFMTSIHGKPIIVSDYFANVAANAKSGAFVSAGAIQILDAGPRTLTRYVNIPGKPNQTGLEIFGNGDCQFVSIGIRLLQHAAT